MYHFSHTTAGQQEAGWVVTSVLSLDCLITENRETLRPFYICLFHLLSLNLILIHSELCLCALFVHSVENKRELSLLILVAVAATLAFAILPVLVALLCYIWCLFLKSFILFALYTKLCLLFLSLNNSFLHLAG